MNESKIRSPKWLRNFMDFEINTGEDITGEPSERMKKKLEERERIKKEEERIKNGELMSFVVFLCFMYFPFF